MREGAKIADIETKSIAWEAGIEPGDVLMSINGKTLKDIFDYHFCMGSTKIKLKIKKRNGGFERIKMFKEKYEDIGLGFHDDLMGDEKSCNNKCVFCFIDQLPPGMRKSLYYKDDDARLSLLHGNYVTLTNTSMKELKRLSRLHISPINISVHTVNPKLREKMMSNRYAGDIMQKIEFLAKKKITMNCQVVLVRGYNDGDELLKTISELEKFHPAVNSLSIVPVGLTKHRKNLCVLEPYDEEASAEVIDSIESLQPEYKKRNGKNFVYAADEFYIMAKRKLPEPEEYDDYPQIENGVGLITSFANEIEQALSTTSVEDVRGRNFSLVTGTAAYDFMKEIADTTQKKFSNINIKVFQIKNKFFGESVTVAGLITGNDIINTLKRKDLGDELLIPGVMLKADEDIFLDNVTPDDISEKLGIKVTPVYISGSDYVGKITGRTTDA